MTNGSLNARDLVARAASPAIATDEKNRIVSWNEAASELLGFGEDALAGRNLHEVTQARDAAGNRFGAAPMDFLGMARLGEAIRPFEIDLVTASEETVRVMVSVVVVLDGEKERSGLIYLLQPVLRRRKADEVIDRLLANPALVAALTRSSDAASPDRPALTERQVEVLRLLARGRSVHEIGAALGITVSTVRSHVQHLLEKLGVHSQVEAVARAFRDRLV